MRKNPLTGASPLHYVSSAPLRFTHFTRFNPRHSAPASHLSALVKRFEAGLTCIHSLTLYISSIAGGGGKIDSLGGEGG